MRSQFTKFSASASGGFAAGCWFAQNIGNTSSGKECFQTAKKAGENQECNKAADEFYNVLLGMQKGRFNLLHPRNRL